MENKLKININENMARKFYLTESVSIYVCCFESEPKSFEKAANKP